MIGKLSGIIDYVAEDHVLIDTQGGIGYVVFCAGPTLRALSEPGQKAALYIEMVVRQDSIQLYGFASVAEKNWHRLLTSVQGVGAKASLALIGSLGLGGLGRALAAGDAQAIRQAPGVGPKIAARIVTELREKAPAMMALGAGDAAPAKAEMGESPVTTQTPGPRAARIAEENADLQSSADALSALINLGYDRSDAAQAVAAAAAAHPGDAGALIKAALRSLGRHL